MEEYIPLIVWGALMFLFCVFEIATAALVSVWFFFGSIAAFICALFVDDIMIQCAVFVFVSVFFLLVTWPYARSIRSRKVATNVDRFVGMEGVVKEEINNLAGSGRVDVDGLEWAAKSTDGKHIAAEKIVIVREIRGVTLYVDEV
ncbi:MAG: NfeD family protein [Planctomycetia bacterium]|nr:NfeD family protein [Planctomycetia bacterium]